MFELVYFLRSLFLSLLLLFSLYLVDLSGNAIADVNANVCDANVKLGFVESYFIQTGLYPKWRLPPLPPFAARFDSWNPSAVTVIIRA